MKKLALFFVLTCSTLTAVAKPLVIAHRGASGYLPEHTLEAKALAYGMGADYLEQDVVMTKDDKLIVLHDLSLEQLTDVKQRFPTRKRQDGKFYVIDFTLDELRSLQVSERFSGQPTQNNANYPTRFPVGQGNFKIHTLAEELEFIQGLNKSTGKNVGIYPEVKSPWFHLAEGKDISLAVLTTLKQFGYTKKSDLVYLQSFDPIELKRIKTQLLPKLNMDIKLVQLIAETSWNETYQQVDGVLTPYSYDWMFKPDAMAKISKYADGIGPWKPMLVSDKSTPDNLLISDMVSLAHKAGLQVHPYTFRADPGRIPAYAGSFENMVRIFVNQVGVDGVFTDFPDQAIKALNN